MSESSDRALLDLIRRRGPLTVAEMAAQLGVTGTAVRNRLTRLLESGLVERQAEHSGPRPSAAHLPGERRGAEAARPELRRPGRRALGRDDEHGRGPQAAPAPLHAGSPSGWRRCIAARSPARSGKAGWSSLSHVLHDRGVEAEVARDGVGCAPDPPAAFLPLLRAGRGRSRDLRPRAQDVREGARPRPAAQPVPARRRPLLRLPGQAGSSASPAQAG